MGEFTDNEYFKSNFQEDSSCIQEMKSECLHNVYDHKPMPHSIHTCEGIVHGDNVVVQETSNNFQKSYFTKDVHHKDDNLKCVHPQEDKDFGFIDNDPLFEGIPLLCKEFSIFTSTEKDNTSVQPKNYDYHHTNESSFVPPVIRNQLSQHYEYNTQQNQNINHPYENEFDDLYFTVSGTRSNTESFSELRFSLSETHSEYNVSESGSNASQEVELLDPNVICSEIKQSLDGFCNPSNIPVDDTTGILYEMCKQINKVPELLSGSRRPVSETSTSSSDTTNMSGGTLEERVFSCINHCDILSQMQLNTRRDQDELGRLEAAVDRMLNQVEIQENLLKEDLNFVPLLLKRKEVKALPLLVNTLCLSPTLNRKKVEPAYFEMKEKVKFYQTKRSSFTSDPNLVQCDDTCRNISADFFENYSIRNLEESVNRLLNQVEKEEEKLGLNSNNLESRHISPIPTSDISSEDDSYSVWWEGAYRSLPRHPGRKRLAKTSTNQRSKSKHNNSNTQDKKNSMNNSESPRNNNTAQSKLLVKTTENGKSALEIRTCNKFTEFSSVEGDKKFSQMFKDSQSQAFSAWNRSLPSLQDRNFFSSKSLCGTYSSDSLNYLKYLQPSDCIQYFIPGPSTVLDSAGYCTWTDRISGGKTVTVVP